MDLEIHKAILEEPEESSFIPKPRPPERIIESKAKSQRAELQERCMRFLQYNQPKVFGIRTAHLSIDDLSYMLSSAKQFKANPQACFWKMLRDSIPK